MIKDATFVSIFDDAYHIESSCKVNTETMEVFDIEMVDVSDYEEDFDSCTYEYVIIDDNEYDVVHLEFREEGDYWYR